MLALAYHDLSATWRHSLSVTPSRFAAQISRLARRGYTGVTLADLAARRTPGRTVAITFDDGFAGVLSAAKPVLDDVGWPATVFVVTDGVGSPAGASWIGKATAERPVLSWPEVELLSRAGWEIGSHGRTHTLLSALGDDDAAAELHDSRMAIERRVGSCTSVSYPWGEVDDRVVRLARHAGYTAGSGLAGRSRRPHDPMAVTRFAVDGGDGALRFGLKTSRTVDALRRTHAWSVLTALRRHGAPLGVALAPGGRE